MEVNKLSATEERLAASMNLHNMSINDITSLMIEEEFSVINALKNCQPQIDTLIAEIVQCFTTGGRLFYVGAGTSGRLGVLDASECPPTFRAPSEMVQGIIAGGSTALQQAVEGAEDIEDDGKSAIANRQINSQDIVIGITASGRTPFVHGALKEAHAKKAVTALITCINYENDSSYIAHLICAVVGPEILSGSTRLKAGTVTKLILNMLTTVSMVRLGKVYQNLMVDLNASNEKLRKRAMRIFKLITKKDNDDYVRDMLEQAHWEVKTAIVMALKNTKYLSAKQMLSCSDNRLDLIID